jgi:hypothetical protein
VTVSFIKVEVAPSILERRMKKNTDKVVNFQPELFFDEIKAGRPEFLSAKTNFGEPKEGKEKLTIAEKGMLRNIFQNRILKANGQKFEDIFTDIMRYADPEFQQIKPYGNTGDKKNDGYIKSKGIYFQVYGPEDITRSVSYATRKLKEDFFGLLKAWKPINEFYFVINDKFNGIPSVLEMEISKLIEENNLKGGVKGASYLENLLFSLEDDQIVTIAGPIPDPYKIKLDFSILNEVIAYIMGLSLAEATASDIKLPDWDKKIEFNRLTSEVARLLNNGSTQMASLDEYLMNQGNFFSDELRNKINEIYVSEKENLIGDALFWRIVSIASPKYRQPYQCAVIVIMAKYFESCDIFEPQPEDHV